MTEIQRGTPLVVCAANRHKETGRIILGARHWDDQMRSQVLPNYKEIITGIEGGDLTVLKLFKSTYQSLFIAWDQGFIDQRLNFLTREEAYVIAKENNQIRFRCGGDEGVLYSENLY
jgi:hypothetical protein